MGTGYVGLVTGACLSDFGNAIVCLDIDREKIARLKDGELPIYEPGLEELVARNTARGRLSFSTEIPFAIKSSEIIFISVGTPALPNGDVDMSYVFNAAEMISEYMEDYKIIVNKSTVPVGTGVEVAELIRKSHVDEDFDIVSNPEFLREGAAIEDFMRPDRVVIGASSQHALEAIVDVYRPLYLRETPMVLTNVASAEMIKYASNTMLAAKISFINEIANICEAYSADVTAVARGMGLDERIGPRNLYPGAGYGGSCFPKDVSGLASIARKVNVDVPVIDAINQTNQRQQQRMIDKLRDLLGSFSERTVCLLGLSFKPDTDDIREAPALRMIDALLAEGASVQVYDPVAMDNTRARYPDLIYTEDPYQAAQGANALVLMTEWNEFRNIDLPRIHAALKEAKILDCRNLYEPREMQELGFEYISVGRPPRRAGETPSEELSSLSTTDRYLSFQ
jgi:UDPglucose 6-dehydrogenase